MTSPFNTNSKGRRTSPPGGQGFSLIEMALVLVVLGLLAVTLTPPLIQSIRQDRVELANTGLSSAVDAIIGYALLDTLHNLPAAVAQATEDADAWNAPFRYHVDASLVGTTDDVCTDVHGTDVDDIRVMNTGETVEQVAFVIASDGPDHVPDITYGAGAPMVIDLRDRRDDLAAVVTLNRFKALVCNEAAASDTSGEPPSGWVLRLEFDDAAQAASELTHGAEVVDPGTVIPGATTPDGYALSLDGINDYWEESGSENYRFTEFTILGWFRTTDGSVGDYEPITSRQSQSGQHNDRNWWITLWANNTTQGHVPGELVFKASPETGSTHFNYDTEAQNRLASPRHHDGLWHFFAATMEEDASSPGDFTAILYVSEDLSQPLATGTQTVGSPPEVGPDSGAQVYKFYVGRDTASGRYFAGLLDDIIVYDRALSPSAIEGWYEDVRGQYN